MDARKTCRSIRLEKRMHIMRRLESCQNSSEKSCPLLTRRIQQKPAEARKNQTELTIAVPPASPTPEERLRLADTVPVTILLQ